MSKSEVAVVDTAKQAVMEYAAELAQDANLGLAANASDYAIPFIYIAQKGSPQVNSKKAEFISGINIGDMFNTVTGEIYASETGFIALPVAFDAKKIEWKDREKGNGGLVAVHPVTFNPPTVRDQKNRDVLQNGNILSYTAQHYIMLYDPESGFFEQAMISMTSTQLKKSRNWNSLMGKVKVMGPAGLFTPPTFATMYGIQTVYEDNDKGDWYGWKITPRGMLNLRDTKHKTVYDACRTFNSAIAAGQVKVSDPIPEDGAAGTSHDDGVM